MNMNSTARRIGAAALALALTAGLAAFHFLQPSPARAAATSNTAPIDDSKIGALLSLDQAMETVASRVTPAIVNVAVTAKVNQKAMIMQGIPEGLPEGMQQFFEHQFGQRGQMQPQQPQFQHGIGSGVIISPDGYIITNNHVVEGATDIKVTLSDRRILQAKLIGTDPLTDLAVIKIDAKKPLPAAKMGNSDGMQVGDWVLAIGSPFGLEETVTAGIVSARGRNIVPQRQFQSFIQTDAAINPGNSGGPLVNMNAEVIGINTAIFTSGGGYQGVGFAMPSNTVVQVYNQLISPDHKVSRGSIGVEFNAVPNPAVQRVYGVSSGVTIANVTPNGPSAKAGLQTGDTIVSVNGKTVATGDELVAEISSLRPGSVAKVGYLRNGKQSSADVTIADRSKLFATRLGDEEEGGEEAKPQENKLGVNVRDITPEVADRLKLPNSKGVIVQEVKPGGFADNVGVSRGDVVLEINKQPVNTETEFQKLQSQLKSGQDVVFLVRPRGLGPNAGTVFMGGTLP